VFGSHVCLAPKWQRLSQVKLSQMQELSEVKQKFIIFVVVLI